MSPEQHLQFILISISTALVSTMIGQNFMDGIFIIGTFILGIVAIDIALAFDMRDCGVHQVNVLISWCFTIGLMLGILFAYVFVRFSPISPLRANIGRKNGTKNPALSGVSRPQYRRILGLTQMGLIQSDLTQK